MAAKRPHLQKLANKLGIMPSYIDYSGVRRFTSDATMVALIEAMGWEAATEKESAKSLFEIDHNNRDRFGTHLAFSHRDKNGTRVRLRVPGWKRGDTAYRGHLGCGKELVEFNGWAQSLDKGEFMDFLLPPTVACGRHGVNITLVQGTRATTLRPYVVIVPKRCWTLEDAGIRGELAGVSANLYTLRSCHNFGVGDLRDAATTGRWVGVNGGDFVGINPLHIVRNRPSQVSPYSPLSRWFQNPVYLDVEAVPEFRQCRDAKKLIASTEFANQLCRLNAFDQIDFRNVYNAKIAIMRFLSREFAARHGNLRTERSRDFARFLEQGGYFLQEFATFCAIDDHFYRSKGFVDWKQWPRDFQNPHSTVVTDFRQANADEVSFHIFVQFELDQQLSKTQERIRAGGARIGLYQDIAVGSVSSGYDVWASNVLFVQDIDVGCPPDAHSTHGQNWSFSPMNPWALQNQAYTFWSLMLRNTMKHAGMVRIDHAMGLMRQFLIPKGRPPSEGAYVRYPMDDLLGILALESHNHKCVVVGEDLGTVPKGFSDTLKKWGILSTRLMMFERTKRGQFRKPSEYRDFAVTSATNHDLPPLKGFVEGTDLELRKRIGLFKSKAAWEKAKKDRAADVRALLRRLVAEGLLDKSVKKPQDVSYQQLLEAVHRFLGRTPSKVVAVMLDDLLGETEPINLPGIGPDKHASWSRRMTRTLEDALADPAVARAFRAVGEGKLRKGSRKGAKPQKKKR